MAMNSNSTHQITLLVGLSGPSSSGKTTLARLLRTVFTPPSTKGTDTLTPSTIRPFILHEDDFYKPDDQIPVVTTSTGKLVQDWDTVEALDISQLESALTYIRDHGNLPAGLRSKEDLNDAKDVDIDEQTVRKLRYYVAQRLQRLLLPAPETQCRQQTSPRSPNLTLALIEGFLLYAPPDDPAHPLRQVHDIIDVPLFLPATYNLLKERREGRTGYVTIGPAPTPTAPSQHNQIGNERNDADSYIPPETNFWTDPPGYVDDIVWPRYITDHAWLLLPESAPRGEDKDVEELRRLVGEGRDVRTDAGVIVAPGRGADPMAQILHWAVDQVLKGVEDILAGDNKKE